ncbi:Kelch repeat-containing protein [Wolbachia endosymbiont of Oedothorax gibbosus]|uniref:hypothetical protein n=1 Tax=Wolbachia endosymbiont of Oedothorax gibbosus TaxID=931100 RepID=UPI002024A26B|nr:hypothetical protein [Wolbachia endosymbiont of Oedothorax gibbosus]
MLFSRYKVRGYPDFQYSSQVDIYDNDNETWITHPTVESRSKVAVAVVGKSAIFFWGSIKSKSSSENEFSSKIDIYDDETGNWTTHTASEARQSPEVAVVGKKAIFFGGYKRPNPYSAKIDIYTNLH